MPSPNPTHGKESLTIHSLPAEIEYSSSASSAASSSVPSSALSTFLIFVHGFPSHKDVGQNREASEQIVKAGIASTVRYSSSRNWERWETAGNDFEKQLASFAGKTYQQELDELRAVVDDVHREFHPEQIYLSGTSYGGGLAALLAGEGIPNLQKVLLSCPQIDSGGRERWGWGCYLNFPPKEAFLEAMAKYQGKLRIIHSIEDVVVPFTQSLELFEAATSKGKKLITFPDGDHVFTGEARKEYVRRHREFFGDRRKI